MEAKVKKYIESNLNINNTIICAISGGVDSVSLLHILYNLGYEVVLAHVNHNKRKESSLEEEAMRSLALELSIPFELLDYHYDGMDNFHNDSHNARYKFFKELCVKYNTNIIATAHHLDDQIETIIMKIMEGSNLYGYGGISICSNVDDYVIIRPLLCCNKEELYNYAKANNLTYFEDSSNSEDLFLRNRIRHNVVPLLKEECSDLYSKISEYSLQVKEAFNFIRNNSIEYLNKTNNKIEYNSFKTLDISIKKDIISLLLETYNIRKNNNIILDILSFIDDNNGTKYLDLEGNYRFVRSYDYSFIEVNNNTVNSMVYCDINDVVIFAEKYKFYFLKNKPVINAKYIKLCYNTIKLPFIIRAKNDGDMVETLVGSKKVSRIFIDNKVPKNLRDDIPIICDSDNNILWVYDLIKSKDVYEQKNNGDLYLVCEAVK